MKTKLQKALNNKARLGLFLSSFVMLVVGFVVATNFISNGKLPKGVACAADARLVCENIPITMGKYAVDYARAQKGYIYKWGGCHGIFPFSIDSKYAKDNCGGIGFDCSGLAEWVWNMASLKYTGQGMAIKQVYVSDRITRNQWAARGNYYYKTGDSYDSLRAYLKPGDLIYFGSPVHHVAIYSGDGKYIDAPGKNRPVQEVKFARTDAVGFIRPRN